MWTKSIRWRFQLWLAFLLVCLLGGFGVTAYQLHRLHRFSQIDEELERRLAMLGADVLPVPMKGMMFPGRGPFDEPGSEPGKGVFRPPPKRPPVDFEEGPGGPPRPGMEMPNRHGPPPDWRMGPREIQLSLRTSSQFDEADTNGFYYGIWSRNGTLLKKSTNAPANLSLPGRSQAEKRMQTRVSETAREVFEFNKMGECTLVGRQITTDLQGMQLYAIWLCAVGFAVLALSLAGGWRLVGSAMRPVEEISATASRISGGNLAERISVEDTDSELGRLAGVLNSTFSRLEAAFAQQKQFTADASHELRTPLAVIINEAQTTLARERTPAEYREALQTCLDASQQMRKLAQSLLELARYDAGQQPLERQPFDLAEQALACVEMIRPLAKERALQIECDLTPAPLCGDADRLSQVITNLLCNAVDYSREQGKIRLSTATENGSVRLAVSDTGEGIAAEDLPHLFKRFYRAEKSRTRGQGRTGLGLAICKAIVDAHGGTIQVASQLGEGTTFTLTLPR